MKYAFLLLLILSCSYCFAQNEDYRVVFDMTSSDSINQQSVVRQVSAIKTANSNAELKVVVYSHGLDLVLQNKSNQAKMVQELIAGGKAEFKVCRMTMKRHGIEESQLIPGVKIVDDGIYEIVKRQKQGWGYIKVGN